MFRRAVQAADVGLYKLLQACLSPGRSLANCSIRCSMARRFVSPNSPQNFPASRVLALKTLSVPTMVTICFWFGALSPILSKIALRLECMPLVPSTRSRLIICTDSILFSFCSVDPSNKILYISTYVKQDIYYPNNHECVTLANIFICRILLSTYAVMHSRMSCDWEMFKAEVYSHVSDVFIIPIEQYKI